MSIADHKVKVQSYAYWLFESICIGLHHYTLLTWRHFLPDKCDRITGQTIGTSKNNEKMKTVKKLLIIFIWRYFSGTSNQNHSWIGSNRYFIVDHLYYKNLSKLSSFLGKQKIFDLCLSSPKQILCWMSLYSPWWGPFLFSWWFYYITSHLMTICSMIVQSYGSWTNVIIPCSPNYGHCQAYDQNSGTLQPSILTTIGAFWLPRISAFFPSCTQMTLHILLSWTLADPNTQILLTLHSTHLAGLLPHAAFCYLLLKRCTWPDIHKAAAPKPCEKAAWNLEKDAHSLWGGGGLPQPAAALWRARPDVLHWHQEEKDN